MDSLIPVEKLILKGHIDTLDNVVKAGFYPLNWSSQRIGAYIEDLSQALLVFTSLVSQVHKNASIIQDIVNRIKETQLICETDHLNLDDQYQPVELNQFFEVMETNRTKRLVSLEQDYNSIGDVYLLKIEETIFHTATGSHASLAIYYQYWERLLYNAITEMILRSMAAQMGFLQAKETGPLIKVSVSMNGKDLVVSPSLTEIDKMLTKGVRNMAESARSFVRWMHRTCRNYFLSSLYITYIVDTIVGIRTEKQIVNEEEEPYVFSFYQDISQNNQVVQLALSITSQTNRVSSITNKYLDGWRRYDKVTGLWNPKRKQQIEKLRPTCK